MTSRELQTLVFKTQNPKSTAIQPKAFLTVSSNKPPAPPVMLQDNQLLAPLFQEAHTLDFQLVLMAKESPAANPKAVSPTKTRAAASPPKKKNGKK
jgi:hypothetical protein